MAPSLLIYGATGYTGGLLVRAAKQVGLPVILCAREESKLRVLASEVGDEFRVAAVDDAAALSRALVGVSAVLNAAGPFGSTAGPLIQTCLDLGVHYLDVTAEPAVIEAAEKRDGDAKRQRVMLMPAVGFDVVPSDCLARYVADR